MTKFKIYLNQGQRKKLNIFRFAVDTIPKTDLMIVYGQNYTCSFQDGGIRRLIIKNEENRHVFSCDWDMVKCMYMNDTLNE